MQGQFSRYAGVPLPQPICLLNGFPFCRNSRFSFCTKKLPVHSKKYSLLPAFMPSAHISASHKLNFNVRISCNRICTMILYLYKYFSLYSCVLYTPYNVAEEMYFYVRVYCTNTSYKLSVVVWLCCLFSDFSLD